MAATGQEASSQTGRRGLGGSSLRPGCGRGDIKVEQVPEGPRTWEVASVSACSLGCPQPPRARRGGGKEARRGLGRAREPQPGSATFFPSPTIPPFATHQEFSPSVWKALPNSDTLSSRGAFPGPLTHSYKWPLHLKNSFLSWIVQA